METMDQDKDLDVVEEKDVMAAAVLAQVEIVFAQNAEHRLRISREHAVLK